MENLTNEQKDIVNADFENLLTITAYAGTGKTTTIMEYARKRPKKTFLYLAYNKSMATEAINKFKEMPWVTVKTVHGLAYLNIGYQYQDRLNSTGLRALDFVDFIQGSSIERKTKFYWAAILLFLIRDWCNSGYTLEEYITVLKEDKCDSPLSGSGLDPLYFARRLPLAWKKILTNKNIPFEHDFYLKIYELNNPSLYFSEIIVDEAQDTSGVMTSIVLKQEKAKKIFIGDSFQQIYRWRGASNSLEKLAGRGLDLYLTESFRCPKQIADLASLYIQMLGAVKPYRGRETQDSRRIIPSDSIITSDQYCYISRTNSRIFDYAATNSTKNIHFNGGFESYQFTDILDIQNLIDGNFDNIKNPFLLRFNNFEEVEEYALSTGEVDLTSRIEIAKKYKDAKSLIFNLKKRNVNVKDADIILTTGHKSKGLEWDNVVLGEDFFNAKKIISKHQNVNIDKEEVNLLYVVMTRAQQKLYLPRNYIIDTVDMEKIRQFVNFIEKNRLPEDPSIEIGESE